MLGSNSLTLSGMCQILYKRSAKTTKVVLLEIHALHLVPSLISTKLHVLDCRWKDVSFMMTAKLFSCSHLRVWNYKIYIYQRIKGLFAFLKSYVSVMTYSSRRNCKVTVALPAWRFSSTLQPKGSRCSDSCKDNAILSSSTTTRCLNVKS